MEPENDGLEDDFSFSIGWFLGSMLIFRGVCFFFHPHLGKTSHVDEYFSQGLKPPTKL